MDWLKDKKNLPIVITVLSVLIVGAGVFLYMQMSGGSPDEAAQEVAMPDAGGAMPGSDPMGAPMMGAGNAPAVTAEPGASPAPAAAGRPGTASGAQPMETWRSDPFYPVGYKPPKKTGSKPKPPIADFPFPVLPRPIVDAKKIEKPEPPQPIRRMSGILLNDRVYAIIETNGQSQIVQPGDTLLDRLATVEKIEANKVILKTTSEKPRYITVRMAASQDRATGSGATTPAPSPYGRSFPRGGRTPSVPMPGAPMPGAPM